MFHGGSFDYSVSVVCSSDYSMEEVLIFYECCLFYERCLFHGGSFDYSVSVVCSVRMVFIPWRNFDYSMSVVCSMRVVFIPWRKL